MKGRTFSIRLMSRFVPSGHGGAQLQSKGCRPAKSIGAGWFDVWHLRMQEHHISDEKIGISPAIEWQIWQARGSWLLVEGILIQ
jgi:hypothetical protein